MIDAEIIMWLGCLTGKLWVGLERKKTQKNVKQIQEVCICLWDILCLGKEVKQNTLSVVFFPDEQTISSRLGGSTACKT